MTDADGEMVIPFVDIGEADTEAVTLRVRVGVTDVDRVGEFKADNDAHAVPETLCELERVRVGDDEVLEVLLDVVENDTKAVTLILRDGEVDADEDRVDILLADSVVHEEGERVASKPVAVPDFVEVTVDFVVTESVGFARVEYVTRDDDEIEVLIFGEFELLDEEEIDADIFAEFELLDEEEIDADIFAEFEMKDDADTDGDSIKIVTVGIVETVIDRDAISVADGKAVAV